MTAATERVAITQMGPDAIPAKLPGSVAASTALKRGWLCGKSATGYVEPFTEAAGWTSAGIAMQDADNSAGNDGDLTVDLLEGVADLTIGGSGDALVDADAPCACYGLDNQTVGKLAASGATVRSIAGVFLGVNAETGKGRVLVGPVGHALAQALADGPSLQAGTLTLVAGTKTLAAGITIRAGSKVFVSLNTPGGATNGADYKVPDAGLVVGGPGTGAFAVTAVDTAGATVATDVSTLNYLIVG